MKSRHEKVYEDDQRIPPRTVQGILREMRAMLRPVSLRLVSQWADEIEVASEPRPERGEGLDVERLARAVDIHNAKEEPLGPFIAIAGTSAIAGLLRENGIYPSGDVRAAYLLGTEHIDAFRLGMAMDMVSDEDAELGVLGRGAYAERVVAKYVELGRDGQQHG